MNRRSLLGKNGPDVSLLSSNRPNYSWTIGCFSQSQIISVTIDGTIVFEILQIVSRSLARREHLQKSYISTLLGLEHRIAGPMVGCWRPPEMINEPQKHWQRLFSPNNRMSNDGKVCPKNIDIVSLCNPHKKLTIVQVYPL